MQLKQKFKELKKALKNSIIRKASINFLNILLDSLLKWFAPILVFTTEEIFTLVNKGNGKSIHLERFSEIPLKWKNEELNEKWIKIKRIRDITNISIENKRANKVIGSSLEAKVKIKLNKEMYEFAKNFDFAEICITSEAEIILDEKLNDEVDVETIKAEGKKCKVCWKIIKGKCERHG